MFPQLLGATLPANDEIRRTANEVVSRSYYEIEVAPPSSGPPLLFVIIKWLLTPFIWLFEALEGLPDFLRWIIVVGLALLCLALTIHIIYSFAVAIRGTSRRTRAAFKLGESRDVPPEDLESEAETARSVGDYMGAVRLLFRAALRRIEVAEEKKFRPGLTNRELLRRYRSSPIFPALERMIETIDLKWYGGQTCLAQDYVVCLAEHQRIRQAVERAGHAHHA